MAKVRINDKSIRRAPPKTGFTELWDDLASGFGARIQASGKRSYQIYGRVDGRQIRLVFAKAPGPELLAGVPLPNGVLSPADARRRAKELLAQIEAGVDPRPPKDASEPAPEPPPPELAVDTVLAVGEQYLADTTKGGGGRLASKDELRRKLMVDLKDWHARPIASISRRDITKLTDAKHATAPISANRLLSFIKRLFRWAVEKGVIEADPASAIVKPGEEIGRERYLSDDEIRWFWRACEQLDAPPDGEPEIAAGVVGRVFKVCLATGQRRGEIEGMLHSELGKLTYKVMDPATGKSVSMEADAWVLPPGRTKRGKLASPEKRAKMRPHAVPLSPLAQRLIAGAPQWTDKDGKPFKHVFASGLAGDQPPARNSKHKEQLDELIGRQMAEEAGEAYDPAKHNIDGDEGWTIHDLRATVSTLMEERLGIPRHVVSRVLNHAEGDRSDDNSGRRHPSTTAGYMRATYDAEAADALRRWAAELERITGENVIPLGQEQV